MVSEKGVTRISKFLSLVLRHQPEVIHLSLDENGWADVKELLHKMKSKGFEIDLALLQHVVAANNKKRFAFDADGTRIRASQGHSIDVDLGYTAAIPPTVLYHGTAEKNVDAILKNGLIKRSRQHVHLSVDKETAIKVGQRHGKPVVFEVLTEKMQQDGYSFYVSENGVWLTDHVPVRYLRLVS